MFSRKSDIPVPCILVVDDEVSNIIHLGKVLQGCGQFVFATDGAKALEMAAIHRPDVVLLDIEMPGMSGFEVCTEIKFNPTTSHCAIIFITSHSDQAVELKALIAGGVDFISKPFDATLCRLRVVNQIRLKQQADALARAERDLNYLVHNLPAFVCYCDAELRVLFSNDVRGAWFGKAADEMHGANLADVIGEAFFQILTPHWQGIREGTKVSVELTIHSSDGAERFVQASLVSRIHDGVFCGCLMLLTDITTRKHVEMALHDEKERIRITLHSIGDAVIATDIDGAVTLMNPIAEDMTGWSSRDATGKPIESVMMLRDGNSGDAHQNPIHIALKEKRIVGMALNTVLHRQGGGTHAVEDSAAPILDRNGEITGAIIVFHDVSEARAMAIKMSHLANHDALTDLPNRILLQDRIAQTLQIAKRSKSHAALLLFDIDHFKYINDAVGYAVGDELLKQLSRRVKSVLRASDTLARLGGDEFIVLLADLASPQNAGDVAEKIRQKLIDPFTLNGKNFNLTVSSGISLFPDDSMDEDTLMRHADVAMYRAKQEGRNCYRFFSSDLEEQVLSRALLVRRLHESLDERSFEIFYQGKHAFGDRRLMGAEALLRMRSRTGELLPPAQFIPVAEETGLIVPIGRLVLEMACQQAVKWKKEGRPLKISVNVSPIQFAERDFTFVVASVLGMTVMDPSLLELEITEGALVRDVEAARKTLLDLKELGVSISIDDFGIGYSSLSYLKKFPVDTLKIDKSFVHSMLSDSSDLAIIQAIVTLARSLRLDLIAEGVETHEQAEALASLGCQMMQGYLFSRPLPVTDFDHGAQKINR